MAEALAVMKLAGPVIAPIISKLAEKASPYFGGDATAEKLDNLRTIILPQIQLIIDAAGDADKIATLGPWLNKLKAAALEADDVLDEWEYMRLENQVNPPAPLLRPIRNCFKKVEEFAAPILFKTKFMKRVDELEKVASEADRFMKLLGLHRDSKTNQNDDINRDTSVPSLPPIVVGREQECEYWVHELTSTTCEEAESSTPGWRAPIHAICGIGGAGKTTLAQSVFNHPRVIEKFGDMRIWVHVPRKLDVAQVTRSVLEFITKGECPRMDTLAALQAKLREIFERTENKILLILDDLWVDNPDGDRMELEKLLQPLNGVGRAGSMVLITTRMEGAAAMLGATNIVPLEELDDETCTSIILHYANRRMDELDADQAWILNTIVPKLKNSPLAARLVGNRLCVVDDWSLVGKGDMLEGTKNALLWSFKRLPSHLRSCFAFCSLFPKGFGFWRLEVDKLVRFWIAQGFVEEPTEAERDLTIEEKGQRYFNELRFFSFFQQHPHEEDGYVIHDLLHDLAEDVSQGHCFRIEDSTAANIPPTVIHLSIAVRHRLTLPISDLMKLLNLRTFLILEISDDFDVIIGHGEKMFKKLAKLRLLQFQRYIYMDVLHSSVCKLKHLRYLQLCIMRSIPESLGTLYHLQYMDYNDMQSNIGGLPKSLSNLVNLRGIRQEVCSKIDDIGRLTSLQKLSIYGADRTEKYGLQQLEKLQQIRGSLRIEGLEFVKDEAGATIAMLKEKRHLEELVLEWGDNRADDVDPDTGNAVLEGLEPPPNLKKLDIMYYKGDKPPSWMGWLLNLTSLRLLHCPNLTVVHNLPRRLKELTVENCPKLMRLYPYPCSLEALVLINWPGTEVFLSSAVESYDKREQQQQQELMMYNCSIESLPNLPSSLRSLTIGCYNIDALANLPSSLTSLAIHGCPNIDTLPSLPSSLTSLAIHRCPNIDTLPNLPSSLSSLEICQCSNIDTLPNIPSSLRSLTIGEFSTLPNLPSSLISLYIRECSNIDTLPNFPSSLRSLAIGRCSKIESLPNLPSSLESLWIFKCHPLLEANYKEGGPLRHEINHIPSIHIFM